MGLLSIFQRNKQTSAKPAGRGGKPAARQAPLANTQNPADAAEAMREVRARARTRLMGATVLLLVGVIGFPLLFETQPRPIPVDLPIEIPARNAPGVVDASSHPTARATKPPALVASGPTPESVSYDAHPSAPMPASAPASEPSSRRSAFASLAAALTSSSAPASAASSVAVAATASTPAVAPARPAVKPMKPAAASTPVPVAAASRPALHTAGPVLPPPPEAKPGPATILADAAPGKSSDPAAGSGRFVVQVGAFLEDAKVREARAKVEKLGMKTYTQPVDTPTGKRVRVRVGPYATKAEADKNAARLKADGLQAVVLAL